MYVYIRWCVWWELNVGIMFHAMRRFWTTKSLLTLCSNDSEFHSSTNDKLCFLLSFAFTLLFWFLFFLFLSILYFSSILLYLVVLVFKLNKGYGFVLMVKKIKIWNLGLSLLFCFPAFSRKPNGQSRKSGGPCFMSGLKGRFTYLMMI